MADITKPSCPRCGSIQLGEVRGKLGQKPRKYCAMCAMEFDTDKAVPIVVEENPRPDGLAEISKRISDIEIILGAMLDTESNLPTETIQQEIESALIRLRQNIKTGRPGQ